MKTLLQSLTLVLAIALSAMAKDPTARDLEFQNDLIPLFTKHGCNAGACHGAAIGRGSLKLSLYGSNPTADYDAIVREVGGRRVNLVHPEQSLLVLKPAEQVEHGGGSIFDFEDESARLLVDWIQGGASNESTRKLERIEVTPRRHIAKALGDSVRLTSVAHYSDGSQRDVSKWTVFAAEDATAVEFDRGSAKTLRRGRHIVVARYLSEVVPVELIVPLTDQAIDLSNGIRNNFIDDEILESLAMLGLTPSPIASDESFLRRVYLDLTGRLPTGDRAQAFLADRTPDKREGLVHELLQTAEFTEYWTLQMAKLLRIRPQQDDGQGALTYHNWVAKQIKEDVSYQQIVRALIMATGDTHEAGPANFYRTVSGQREQAEFVSELFMGSRLRCANCHDHPLDHWTQDDYHGLAAIFAKVERGRMVRLKPNGKTIHPKTLEPALQRIPGELFLADDATDGREQFADWLTHSSNPYLAKAIVNRLWKRMMGRGLVEPVNDFRSTNPATHPALLDRLADDFKANGYSLRHTLMVIATSNAYSRSARVTRQNKDDDRFYSHAFRRPLEPEVLADAISDVLGVADRYGSEPVGTRAVALFDPRTPSTALDILGRCGRDESCEKTSVATGGLSQKLHLLNGDLINARIMAKGSRLKRLLDSGQHPEGIVEEFYWVALGRHPTTNEKEHWNLQLHSASNATAFLEDFVWAVVSSNEFTTNH